MSQQRDRDTLSPPSASSLDKPPANFSPLPPLPTTPLPSLLAYASITPGNPPSAASTASDAAASAASSDSRAPLSLQPLVLPCPLHTPLPPAAPPQPPPQPPQRPRSPLTSVPDGAWTFDLSDASLSAWLGTLRWQPLRLVLQHTLLQATACFADRRFEVRRMAEQVLRPLVEVALWAEPPVLMQLWASFLPVVDSLPCWVSASTLLLALQRCSAFEHLARRDDALTTRAAPTAHPPPPPPPPGPGAHPSAESGGVASVTRTHPSAESGGEASVTRTHPSALEMSELVTRVHALLPSLLPLATALVDRAATDKVCVLGAQLCALLQARFPHRLQLATPPPPPGMPPSPFVLPAASAASAAASAAAASAAASASAASSAAAPRRLLCRPSPPTSPRSFDA